MVSRESGRLETLYESIQPERQICFAISLILTFCSDSIDSDRKLKELMIVQLAWVKGDLLIVVLPRFLQNWIGQCACVCHDRIEVKMEMI